MIPKSRPIRLFPPGDMKPRTDTRGITLLETVLYIGLFAVVLLAATTFFLEFGQSITNESLDLPKLVEILWKRLKEKNLTKVFDGDIICDSLGK